MCSRITGWSPINQNGDRVQLAPQSDTTNPEPYSPLPDVDATSSPERSPSPEPEPPRKGDPDWVARPRNSFIIFRCEFARQNTGIIPPKGQRSADDPPEKSLSKRASEAWKALPPSEKLRFQAMADMEKEQHAKDNPGYRFKPVRRPSNTRKSRRSTSSNSTGPVLRRTRIARRQRSGRSSPTPSPEKQSEYSETPTSSTLALPDTAATSISDFGFVLSGEDDLLKAVKAAHRRSTSAPRLFSGSSYEPASRIEFRRSKSITEGWQVPIPHQWPYDAVSYPMIGNPEEFVPTEYVVTPPSPSINFDFHAFKVSPFTAVASSLVGWNGETPPSPTTQTTLAQSDTTPSWPDSYNNSGQTVQQQQQPDFVYSQSQNPGMNEVTNPWVIQQPQPRSLYNLPNDPIQSYSDPTMEATLQELELGVTNGQYPFGDQTMSDEDLFKTFLV